MSSVLIGISYGGAHNKGQEAFAPESNWGRADYPDAVRLDGGEHARWLLKATYFYCQFARKHSLPGWDHWRVVVTATGLPSILKVPAGKERDALWEVASLATILSYDENPGHQLGASLCVLQGVEAAAKWGYEYYIHAAEDVIPKPGVLERMVVQLGQGNDYVGSAFPDTRMLISRFFGCRTRALVNCFDPGRVGGYQGLEHYLYALLGKTWSFPDEHYFWTTHRYDEYQRMLLEVQEVEPI
jgi:hypothetical protein